MKPSIYGLEKAELIAWFEANGEKKFRATQVWEWLYEKRVMTFAEMTNLSKAFIPCNRWKTNNITRKKIRTFL